MYSGFSLLPLGVLPDLGLSDKCCSLTDNLIQDDF